MSPRRRIHSAGLVVALVAAVVALLAIVAPDARWLAALGGEIVARGGIPQGVPYAAAPSGTWHNVPVLAELAFHGLEAVFGDSGLALAQIVAVALGFAILAVDAVRAGAGRGLTPVLLLAAFGLPLTLIGVRVQLFSLALFPLLLALLRAEARDPSRRIWLVVPLVALWSNLHGAVLAGLAVTGAYLVVDRARREPFVVVGVLAGSGLALAATPALLHTYGYYQGVLENEAAKRGFGLWAPLDVHDTFDLLLILVALPLLALAVRARPRVWELVALAGLAALTVQTARGGVWLLFAAVAPASRAAAARWMPATVPLYTLVPFAVVAAVGILRGPLAVGAGDDLLRATIARAHGAPVLADGLSAEQIALAGGRVWISNPLDAFPHADQRLYLDWLQGEPAGDAALDRVRIVLVRVRTDAQRRMVRQPGFREVGRDSRDVLYARS